MNLKVKAAAAAVLALWVGYLFIVVLFYPVGGDAPSYYYGIMLMTDGLIPTVDFFSLQPPGFYLPYYFVAELLSPSWEALRLLSLASFVATSLMISYLVLCRCGFGLGAIAFVIMGMSHFWFYWNATIIHYSISNLTLLAAFLIIYLAKPTRLSALLAGLAAGWCVDTRLSLGPAAVFLFYLLLRRTLSVGSSASWREALASIGVAYVAGGVLGALPGIVIFAMDPAAAYESSLKIRSLIEADYAWQGESLWQQLLAVLQVRLGIVWSFFFWFDDSLKAQIGNAIVLVVAVIAGLGIAGLGSARRRLAIAALIADPLIRGAGLLALVIFLSHAITVLPSPYYVQSVFPLLVVVVLGAVHHVLEHAPTLRMRAVSLSLIGIALVPYTLYFLFWTAGHLVRRDEPSTARPVTNANVACWLEQNTAPNAKILAYQGLPVALAKRRMPDSWTYPPLQTLVVSTVDVDANAAARAHLLTREQFLSLFRMRTLDVFVADGAPEYEFRDFTELLVAINENYVEATSSGGAFPYRIYVRKADWRADLPQLPTPRPAQLSMRRLREQKLGDVIRSAFDDIGFSIATFPRSLADAMLRMIDAPFERRCRTYLASAEGQPLTVYGVR